MGNWTRICMIGIAFTIAACSAAAQPRDTPTAGILSKARSTSPRATIESGNRTPGLFIPTATDNRAQTSLALTVPFVSVVSGKMTLLATLSPLSSGSGTPAGTVRFVDLATNATLTTATLTSSTASSSVDAIGTHPLQALYSGDSTFAPSTSPIFFAPYIAYLIGFAGETLAPDQIGVILNPGTAFSTGVAIATALPTSLTGTRVSVTDSAGVVRPAPLYLVAPVQINFVIPAETAAGSATVTATAPSGFTFAIEITISPTAPNLFGANLGSNDVAAAEIVRVKPDGSQVSEAVSTFDSTRRRWVATPIRFGNDALYLVLYGTGIRHGRNVVSTIGGVTLAVLYSGAQPSFTGLDQVNIQLPLTLGGAGLVSVTVSTDGQLSNFVTLTFD